MKTYNKSEKFLERCRPIIMIEYLTNEVIDEYDSIQECADDNDLQQNLISAVAQGKRKHHKGYTFKYK